MSLPHGISFDEFSGALKVVEKPKSGQYSFTGIHFTSFKHIVSVLASSSTGDVDWTTVVLKITSLREDILRISSSSCGTVSVPENVELMEFKRIIVTGNKGNVKFRIQGTIEATNNMFRRIEYFARS